jgi:hypothetical protein
MSQLADRPFLTERFEPEGGGIDFLGMRQVNLAILQEELIPGVNNATSDFGVFCLGAWIPWKFRQLCEHDPKSFVLSRYNAFREAVEVAMAFATRDGAPGNKKFGEPHRRIGVRQRFQPPAPMTFKSVKRTGATSLYAAPLYGPALWCTGFIVAYAKARDGTSTGIPYIAEDEDTGPGTDDEELVCRLRMLARWWVRAHLWLAEGTQPQLLQEGDRNRISIRWFWDWLHGRLGTPVRTLLTHLYSELVFAQHIKVALARFDGQIQRLRFTLGDAGIIPTAEARGKLGDPPGRMVDRLDAIIGLLCDVDVLHQDKHGNLSPGLHRRLVEEPEEARTLSKNTAHVVD